MNLSQNDLRRFIAAQRNEISEHLIYKKLAEIDSGKNREVLLRIAEDESSHYYKLKDITGKELKPKKAMVFFYVNMARLLGVTFSLKFMEKGEDLAQKLYRRLKNLEPNLEEIIADEEKHERELLNLINEGRLQYAGSIVLGLNDALVELTGALAGLTLALRNQKIIAIVGFITGIAAAMSMGASEYLSTKQEDNDKSPLKASIYTGVAYLLTVIFLILPYLLFANIYLCLLFVVINALVVICLFTFYISVARDLSFKKRFLEMAGLSLTIAVISFFIGLAVRKVFGVDV
jgi:VIT1/CCC1 family predicted Fe2+/Mn2+ transporter